MTTPQPLPSGEAPPIETETKPSAAKKYLGAMSPRTLWSMADGYPVVLKQFIQFCLIIIYPAWVFAVLLGAAMHLLFYVTVYPVLWVLFWPLRAYQKKHHPEEYAESQRQK
ncbi:hypothetical protein MGALJ_33560 [Mycobacterium gallinarum]|uniref:Uncharacterized protein n=1 Tax=Mycobacterium gallinarum TaxID=39689 RepID=A0A9W4FFX9_9MYCO|nr:hypothetical protein [Mycobacterium gallinarum]BBY93687.1 hypothetical protein MGALJ_33560 [Mycobacterium gallinarum]